MSRKRARDWTKPLTEESCLGVPEDLFASLHKEFCFTVDACSTDQNAVLDRHWTRKENGLLQSWENEVVWCHPLFDRDIIKWIEKGLGAPNCIAVYLLPASTDTRWFASIWNYQLHAPKLGCQVRFLPKRLKYRPALKCAAFASCIVVVNNRLG